MMHAARRSCNHPTDAFNQLNDNLARLRHNCAMTQFLSATSDNLTRCHRACASIRDRRSLRVKSLFNFFKPAVVRPNSDAQELLQLARTTNRGLVADSETKKRINELVEKLVQVGAGSTTTGKSLSSTWKLVYTTEKVPFKVDARSSSTRANNKTAQETLFIVKNAGIFGTTAGDVYQVIDIENNSLQNVITFPPDGAFVVNSSIRVASEQRVEFKFTNAQIKLPSRVLNLPPFGQGWFDTVYLDANMRVAKDIRGDTLIVERDGPPITYAYPDAS